MTGRSVGWLDGWLVGWLVAAGRLVSAVTRKRPPRFATSVLSYVSNFLYNETPGYEMTNVIKASSHRRSGIPEIFTMGNAHLYIVSLSLSFADHPSPFSLCLSFFLSLPQRLHLRHRDCVYFRIIFCQIVVES